MSTGRFASGLRGLVSLKTTSDELLHLDLMRFIASAAIVLCHSGEFFVPRASRPESFERLAGLSLFVDVFFIISGFVIAHIYADRMGTWRQFARFMQRRIGRLFPLHLATLFAVGLLFYLIGVFNVPTNTDMRLVPECLVLGTLLLHSVIDCGGPVPNGVNWSISAEMVMYALFPLLLLAARSLGLLRYGLWLVFLIGVSWTYAEGALWASKTEFLRALPAFFFGLVLRLDWERLDRFAVPGMVPVGFALALIAGSLLVWPGWLLLALAYAAAASAILADTRPAAAPLTRRLAPLGQLTYSMYMLHPIIIMVLVNAVGDKLLKLDPVPLGLVTLASYGLIMVVSLLSYKWFEQPARAFIDGLPLVPPERAKGGNEGHV
ncbi:MAG TPA: acyltransferase [Novosphingobium sp.]|nr:acyltransferase [Novosphingobium sp.]